MELSGISTYREHSRVISFQTSSGDSVELDMYKKQEETALEAKSENGYEASYSFASVKKFSFSYKGDGIDDQDRAEIEAFMEKITPLIEDFYNDEPEVPYNEAVNKIATPIKAIEDEDLQNYAKSALVETFDKTIDSSITQEKLSQMEEFLKDILAKIERPEMILYG